MKVFVLSLPYLYASTRMKESIRERGREFNRRLMAVIADCPLPNICSSNQFFRITNKTCLNSIAVFKINKQTFSCFNWKCCFHLIFFTQSNSIYTSVSPFMNWDIYKFINHLYRNMAAKHRRTISSERETAIQFSSIQIMLSITISCVSAHSANVLNIFFEMKLRSKAWKRILFLCLKPIIIRRRKKSSF